MLIEIRKAQIVVADFTGLKTGVYFEAGFALALGREVFWTCHKGCMADVHFDTNHYQHIEWSSVADLKSRLFEKIVAVSGAGPMGAKF